MNLVRETEHPDRVALTNRDVAEHEHGVERMIEKADTVRLVRHHAAAIDQKNNSLALVRLKIFYGEFSAPCTAPPIDVLKNIIASEIAQPFEFVVLTNLSGSTHTHHAKAIRSREQRILFQLLHV